MIVPLYDHQKEALKKMHNGCILNGDTGSGKSRTALAYYFVRQGGQVCTEQYVPMDDISAKDLYIITTARKRDERDWEDEMIPFLLTTNPDESMYKARVYVDSWNNIEKYKDIEDAFFIFDEQRVVGKGVWSKSFIKIAKHNEWVLLSATPGDTWQDYESVFIANGFYRNRTEFEREHIVWAPRVQFPKVDRYIGTGRLIRLRNNILVDMECDRKTIQHHEDIYCEYDVKAYKTLMRERWNPWRDEPMKNASEFCQCLRRCVNSDEDRQVKLLEIFEKHPKMIVFYNYNYELDILRNMYWGNEVEVAEWNGSKHQPIPTGKTWVYFVQYTAGAEGWNCVSTDTIVFYSQNYSYKILKQSCGRIDRINTKFVDLYYYHLKSRSGIDVAIGKAVRNKKKFNEGKYFNKFGKD